MGRVLIILAAVAVVVVFVVMLHGLWRTVSSQTRAGLRTYAGFGKEGEMAPSGLQKVAYIALLVVLLGVTSGWLGGL